MLFLKKIILSGRNVNNVRIALRVNVIMPYYGYQRQDRKDYSRAPISAKVIASCLESLHINRVIVFDLHAGQVQGFFSNQTPFDNLYVENQKVRTRVKDLQSYKTDVSKTFQILDNELVMINDHLQKRNDRGGNQVRNIVSNANAGQQPSVPIHTTIQTSRIPLTRISSFANMPSYNNVSLLTPELLSSLFNMNTEELRQSVSQQPPQQQDTQPQQQPPQ